MAKNKTSKKTSSLNKYRKDFFKTKNKLEFRFYFLVYLVKFVVVALSALGLVKFSLIDDNYVKIK